MEINEVMNWIKDLNVISNIVNNTIWFIISGVFIELVTMLKSSQTVLAKITDFKHRKIIHSVILSKIKDDPFMYLLRKIICYWVELFFCMGTILILLCVCQMAIVFLNMRYGVVSYEFSIYINWGIMGGGVLGCMFLAEIVKKIHAERREKVKWLIVIFISSIYLLYMCTMVMKNEKIYFLVLGCIAYIWTWLVIGFLYVYNFYDSYKNKFIQISWWVRYTVLLIAIYYSISQEFKYTIGLIFIWLLVGSLEYYCSIILDDTNVVDAIIHLKSMNVEVRDTIVQCDSQTVKFITKEKVQTFGKVEDIKCISYELNHCRNIISKKVKQVVCFTRDGAKKYYHYYNYINESWIAFVFVEARRRKIDVYPLGVIEKYYIVENLNK